MCLHPEAFQGGVKPVGWTVMRCFGLLLLALPVTAVVPSAQAQYYRDYRAPQPYYRAAPPPDAYDDRLPAPGYFADDDDYDEPVIRGPRRRPQVSQMPQQGQPNRNLPYPAETDAAPPPPDFASPDGRPPYGHQLESVPPIWVPPAGARIDPDVPRPPGAIGSTPDAPLPAAAALPPEDRPEIGQPKELPENLRKQLVDYSTIEPAGTIIVDTPNTYLYFVLGNSKAIRYGVRVGREGFTWTGVERISRMSEWPDWHPPAEMIERQPYLPRFMAGGNGNPLGARAMYLGKTLYRIHGTNQPSTIGHYVSSGCVGMLNEDVEDLFSRVQVGTRVVVLPGKAPDAVANSSNPPEPANPMAPPRPGAAVSGAPLPAVR
jgi:lipoprotein-anchoring transpeptidase ErfK/SrfK